MFDNAIDYEFIDEDSSFCSGYARSVATIELPYGWPRFDNYAVAATYYRRAAEHELLLSTVEDSGERVLQARELFNNAATQYKNWGSPYAFLMAFIANGGEATQQITDYLVDYLDRFESQIRPRPAKLVQYVYALMVNQGQSNLSDRVREWIESLRHHRVGLLGLSVNQILNVVETSDGREGASFLETMTPVLGAYDEALQTAMLNSYHFRRLLMNFHPVNAEVIGLLLRINSQFPAISPLERSSISAVAKSFLIQLIRNLTQSDRFLER